MMVRTTKQIWAEAEAFIYDLSKDSVEPDKEWVCLSDLKKEITALAKREDYKFNEVKQIVLDDVYDLCNSSEQNVSNLCGKDVNAKDSGNGDVAVSGEHDRRGQHPEGESSPVQNPEELVEQCRAFRGGERTCDEHDCKNKLICPDYVQKKCTCPVKCEVCEGLGNIDYCCRCGGAL